MKTRRQSQRVKELLKQEMVSLIFFLAGIILLILYIVRGIVGPEYVMKLLENAEGLKWSIIFCTDFIIHMGLFIGPIISFLAICSFSEEREEMQKITSKRR
ncbi:MAG: hypothetical protein HFJ17_06100 [Clostridia bacterium]|nr:hypothetical protein [Clostridia bacterium]